MTALSPIAGSSTDSFDSHLDSDAPQPVRTQKSGVLQAVHRQIYDSVSRATVQRIPTGVELTGADLWDVEPALIFVVRRSGCPLCRSQALLISHSRVFLRRLGYRTIAVLNSDDVDNSDFAAKHWNGKLVLDKPLAFYSAVGGGQVRKAKFGESLTPAFSKRIFRVMGTQRVMGTPRSGRGPILGGMLLVGQGDEGIQYLQTERTLGDFQDFAALLRMAYAHSPVRHEIDPEEIEEAIAAHKERLGKRLPTCDGDDSCPTPLR